MRASVAQRSVTAPQRVLDHNDVARLDVVRRLRKILPVLPPYYVLARRPEVVAALGDSAAFPTCYPPDLLGDFVSRFEGDEHAALRKIIAGALEGGDATVAELATRTAEGCVASGRATGSLDVGADLVHPVIDTIVRDYVGITGVRPDVMLAWARDLFQGIFLNPYAFGSVHDAALAAKRQMGARVDTLLAARGVDEPTVLSRLLDRGRAADPPLSDDAVRDNLIGLTVGWLWHGSRAAIIAVDELLERPDALALARRAAKADDLDAVRRVLWEVLRFRPVQTGLVRTCPHGAALAPGRSVPAGARVLCATHSAMWDDEVVPDPTRFDVTRADEQYLIFGAGDHACPGADIVHRQLPAMLAPLLRKDWINRAPGRAGRLRWVGPSPDGLRVTFPVPGA